MNKRLIARLLGAILVIEALAMLPSLLVSLIYRDGDAVALLWSMACPLVLGLPAWFLIHPGPGNLKAREGFLVVTLAWCFLSVFGALPFVFSGVLPNFWDALFESVSGFTTTGATVMSVFEGQPRGIMFWRSFTHWVGGMGVLVLTLALLPQLTGRTASLVRAESPGPSLSKLVPKMGDTAKILYSVYTALTVLMFVALLLTGLSPYDAAIHALSTAGTGGFSNYGDSVGAFGSVPVEIVCTVFMILFSLNFALYYHALKGNWKEMLHSEETHWFLGIYGIFSIAIAIILVPYYHSLSQALRYSTFNVASLMSTTGFGNADFTLWPAAAQMLIFVLMFLGGCVGSTAGGIKTMRLILLLKMARRDLSRTVRPRKVQIIRLEGKGVEDSTLNQTAVFFFVYIATVLVGAIALSFQGLYDVQSNLSAALTCVSNVGPGLGYITPSLNFTGFTSYGKIVCSLLMLCGRLELYPILLLFSREMRHKT